MRRKIYIVGLVIVIISIASTILVCLYSDNHKEVVGKAIFKGNGQTWNVFYEYDSKRYSEHHVNYITIVLNETSKLELKDIDIKIKSKHSTVTGNVGDMHSEVSRNKEGKNAVKFLVGTLNSETFYDDKYEIIIYWNDDIDKILLKYKEEV